MRYLTRPEWPDSEECVAGTLPSLEGIWDGLVQGEPLGPLAGLEITIEIVGSNGSGQPCGSVRFGEDVELPPASDPDDFYPPGSAVALRHLGGDPIGFSPSQLGPVAGAAYTIQDASLEGLRLNWQVAIEEPYRGWCALQAPVPSELVTQSCYNCIGEESGELGWTPNEDACLLAGKPLSCFRFAMCMNGLCWCSADECEASNLTKLSFEVLLDNDEMQGVIHREDRDGDPAVWLKRRE